LTPRVLLFDLGGVLVEYDGFTAIRALLRQPLSEEALIAGFAPVREFQTGALSADEFGDQIVSRLPLTTTAPAFLAAFETWSRALYPGAADLLGALRPHHRLVALTNTNVLHWRRNVEVLGVDALFERCFASHEIGLAKPDAAAYLHVLDALAVEATAVTFFDDQAVNVVAARQLGIDAHQVAGVEELRACLIGLGLLEA
jgi:putative hydrolase of the HAD superfamily